MNNVTALRPSGKTRSARTLQFFSPRPNKPPIVVTAIIKRMSIEDNAHILYSHQEDRRRVNTEIDDAVGNIRSLWNEIEDPKRRNARSMRIGRLILRKHHVYEYRCSCHVAPEYACPKVLAGDSVTFTRVDLPDRISVKLEEDETLEDA